MRVTLMFSGGKDSFLAACKLVEQGNQVDIVVFNSGCVAGEKNALHTAERLVKKYKNRVYIAGIRTTVATRMIIDRPWKELSNRELCSRYPNVNGVQSQCFFCQTSMILEAIAYCKAHNIKALATGYKSSDTFCTGTDEYVELIRNISCEYGVELLTPMWDFIDDDNGLDRRNQEMIYRKFLPSVLEPKCTVGLPANIKISKVEIRELINYFHAYIDYKMLIDKTIPILKTIKLTDESMESCSYSIKGNKDEN